MNRLLLFVCLFLFIYPPVLRLWGVIIHVPEAIFFALAGCGALLVISTGVQRPFATYGTLYVSGLLYLMIMYALGSRLDALLWVQYVRAIGAVVAAYALGWGYANHPDGERLLLRHVFGAGALHAAIMAATLFAPTLAELLYRYVVISDEAHAFLQAGVRTAGLTATGGDGLSITQAATLVFGISYFAIHERRPLPRTVLLYTGLFALSFFGIVFAGRTGLVLVAASLPLILLMTMGGPGSTGSVARRRLFFLTVVVTASVTVGAVVLAQSDYARLYRRAFELFINLLQSGELRTSSTDIMGDMVFLPSNPWALTFGTGNFGRSGEMEYIPSDIGFVRAIFGAGLVGTALLFAAVMYIMWYAWAHVDRVPLRMLMSATAVMMVLANLKVLHIVATTGLLQVMTVLFAFTVILHASPAKVGRTASRKTMHPSNPPEN